MIKKLFLGTFLALMLFQGTCFAVPYDQYTATGNESFWDISQKAGVRVSELINVNPYVEQNNISKGLFINLPIGHKPIAGLIPSSQVSRRTYTVQSGDTVYTISKKFGISYSYLLSANSNGQNLNNIKPGLALNIPTAPISITPSTSWETKANYIISLGKDQFDVPYVWGGITPWIGMDCSSFVQYLYKKIGINLPRTSNWQFQYGTPVPKDQLRKGDLVFFKEHGSAVITHVGMYIGNDLMLNADTAPKNGVQLSHVFGDVYYNSTYAGARRFIH